MLRAVDAAHVGRDHRIAIGRSQVGQLPLLASAPAARTARPFLINEDITIDLGRILPHPAIRPTAAQFFDGGSSRRVYPLTVVKVPSSAPKTPVMAIASVMLSRVLASIPAPGRCRSQRPRLTDDHRRRECQCASNPSPHRPSPPSPASRPAMERTRAGRRWYRNGDQVPYRPDGVIEI